MSLNCAVGLDYMLPNILFYVALVNLAQFVSHFT